jgi:hypothetical protein
VKDKAKMDQRTKYDGGTTHGQVLSPASRHSIDYPTEEDILASAPEGWSNYIRQLGTDFIAQVSIYNEVLHYLDVLTEEGATFDLSTNKIGPNRIDWLAASRVLLLDNSALGVCWMFWISTEWEPVDTRAGFTRHRALQLADVRACIKVMSPTAYAEHMEWEMDRTKH